MEILRELRKTFTFGLLRMGMEAARRTNDPAVVEGIHSAIRGISRVAFPIRLRLAKNMQMAGAYRPDLLNAHIDRILDQMAMMGHIFQFGWDHSGCPQKFVFDDSFKFLEQTYHRGKGVILIAPHLCCYPIFPRVISDRLPCCIYLRRNKDPRKFRITEAISRIGAADLVCPPPHATKMERLQVALDVLRQKKMMFITPDTPRKPDEGVPVTIFGRTAYFPTGVYVMSLRTGAPIVSSDWYWRDGAFRVRFHPAVELSRRHGGDIRQQMESATRAWADQVDEFLHLHPEMWWNWLDKRWTKIMRGEDRYSLPADAPQAQPVNEAMEPAPNIAHK